MDLLQEFYWGNTLQKWLTALLTLIFVFAALKITQSIVIRKLSKLAAVTETKIDDLFVCMLKQTNAFIVFILSVYIASTIITLSPFIAGLWQKVVTLILLLQAGLWASAGINFAFNQSIQKRKEQDASGTTTIKFLGFIARFILWIIVLLLVLDNVGVNIRGVGKKDVARGDVICDAAFPATIAEEFTAQIAVINHPTVIAKGYTPVFHVHTAQVPCQFIDIISKIDPTSGQPMPGKPDFIKNGDVAMVKIKPMGNLVLETSKVNPHMARFAIRDAGATVAAGVCVDLVPKKLE